MKSSLSLATLFTGITFGLVAFGLITPAMTAPASMVKSFSVASIEASQVVEVQNRNSGPNSQRRSDND